MQAWLHSACANAAEVTRLPEWRWIGVRGGIAAALLIVFSFALSWWTTGSFVAPAFADPQIQRPLAAPIISSDDVALAPFPRPRGRFGLHDTPIIGGSRDLDRAFRDWESLNVSWVTVLDPREELLDRASRAGIMVVARVYSRSIFEQGDLRGVTDRMVRHGMPYVIPYNEPNLRGEVAAQTPDPVDFARRWLAAAEIIRSRGGYPVLTPLAPEGDYPDLLYLRKLLQEIVAAKGAKWLVDNRVVVGLHSYVLRPGDDYAGRFLACDDIVREVTGLSLPILVTEGGVAVGKEHPANTPELVSTETLKIVEALHRNDAPRRYLGMTLWLYSNQAQGGRDEKFEQAAWYQQRGPQPIVEEVRRRFGPRLDPLPSRGLLLNMSP